MQSLQIFPSLPTLIFSVYIDAGTADTAATLTFLTNTAGTGTWRVNLLLIMIITSFEGHWYYLVNRHSNCCNNEDIFENNFRLKCLKSHVTAHTSKSLVIAWRPNSCVLYGCVIYHIYHICHMSYMSYIIYVICHYIHVLYVYFNSFLSICDTKIF